MAVKHQIECYRTIKGQKYVNWCDLIFIDAENDRIVANVKAKNIPHRIFKHPDGFRRLFVLESEVGRIDYKDFSK